MRHIKNYNELFEAQTELSQEQIEWLDKFTKGHWFRNPETGLVDVDGDFDFYSQLLSDFKGVRFGVVTGTFNCSDNQLTSLEGAPQKVGWYFICSNNELTSLEGAPQKVGRGFECSNNSLTSLVGAPQEVGGYFNCSRSELTSLVGAPQEVGTWFDCSHNRLTSLEGAPQEVGRGFDCGGNLVSERTLKGIYKKMQSGLSWPDAVANFWRYIRSEEDKILLAPHHPDPSREDVKGYQSLSKFRNKII
jgi:hypothetical protein